MIWLIPGMDGTGRMFEPLLAALGGDVQAVSYRGGSYAEALASLPAALRTPAPDDVVVAESFGGPLALRIAAQHPVAKVVLVASFVRCPRWLPPSALIAAMRPPRLAIRAAMVGLDAPSALVDMVSDALHEVPGEVIAKRLDALRSLDATEDLVQAKARVVWLRATADRLVPGRAATDVALGARPDLIVHDVPGPHLLAQRWPERVAALVR